MDSTGAGLLFTVIRWLGEHHAHFKVKNASDDLRWVMKITGLEKLLDEEGPKEKRLCEKAS